MPGTGSLLCCDEVQRPLPTEFATVIDFSSIDAIPRGTCSDYVYDPNAPTKLFRGYWLPTDPAAYPIKLILPALSGADPACEQVCPPYGGPKTAFGIGLEGNHGLSNADAPVSAPWSHSGPLLSVRVPAPWFFVSGGCGEACSWPCLNGYQEFGEPRTCATPSHAGGFGFATADPSAPSVEAIIELIDIDPAEDIYEKYPRSCCVYPDAFK